eukprot:10234234-Prorocentrum_lima.AAC.1
MPGTEIGTPTTYNNIDDNNNMGGRRRQTRRREDIQTTEESADTQNMRPNGEKQQQNRTRP